MNKEDSNEQVSQNPINRINYHKHIIYSAILCNILIVLTIVAYFAGFKHQWFIALTLILPVLLYSLKTKEYCKIKYCILYSIYTVFPIYLIAGFLFLLSLLINPLGVMIIGELLKYAFLGWISIFISFMILNFCFIKLHKLLSKTHFYESLSLKLFGLIHKNQFVYILVSFITVAALSIFTFINVISANNRFLNLGISELMKKDSYYSKAIIYDKNKLLIVYYDKYEVFDLDKREKIKYGTIDGLKVNYRDMNGFSLNLLNDESVLITGYNVERNKNMEKQRVLDFGILNLKDFSYKPLGEFVLERSFPENVFSYDNRNSLIITDFAKAYIFDTSKMNSFPLEKEFNYLSDNKKLIPFKDNKYLLVSNAVVYPDSTNKSIDYNPLIQVFDPHKKSLKTIYYPKSQYSDTYRYMNTFLLNNDKLLIIYIPRDGKESFKLRLDTIDLEKGEKISERVISAPEPEFSIEYAVLQYPETLLLFGSESRFRHGVYIYNLKENSFNKTMYKANLCPDNSDKIFVLDNGDIVICGNIYSEGKIFLFKNKQN